MMIVLKILTWMKNHKIPVRLIISVIAGIMLAMILSFLTHELLFLIGIFPQIGKPMFDNQLVIIELVYHSLYAVAGGYLTAKIAEKKARRAVFILGTKEAIMWLLGTLLLWNHSPAWYNLTKALLGVPLAMLGGFIYEKIKKRRLSKTKRLNNFENG